MRTSISLITLPLLYPNHIILLGGDFQGHFTSSSDKSCHLRTLPFTLFNGLHLPTFTPAHQPTQTTCIDHFLYFHPLQTNIQTQDTQNITHAFLDHEGLKAKIKLPLTQNTQLSTPPITQNNSIPPPIKFHFPLPHPLLTQWKN